jgi:signal transduction histidine kinase
MSFILLMAAVFFYFLFKNQRKLSASERKFAEAELAALEEERQRISMELHNDVVPMLAALRMMLYMGEQKKQPVDAESLQVLEDAIKKLRILSQYGASMDLRNQLFGDALLDYAHTSGFLKQIDLQFNDDTTLTLPEQYHQHLYRLLQEVMINTKKHSQATELKIHISKEGKSLLIRTADNGVGFDMTEEALLNGLGLRSIRKIVQHLGGTMAKAERALGGTKYNFRIPLP